MRGSGERDMTLEIEILGLELGRLVKAERGRGIDLP